MTQKNLKSGSPIPTGNKTDIPQTGGLAGQSGTVPLCKDCEFRDSWGDCSETGYSTKIERDIGYDAINRCGFKGRLFRRRKTLFQKLKAIFGGLSEAQKLFLLSLFAFIVFILPIVAFLYLFGGSND